MYKSEYTLVPQEISLNAGIVVIRNAAVLFSNRRLQDFPGHQSTVFPPGSFFKKESWFQQDSNSNVVSKGSLAVFGVRHLGPSYCLPPRHLSPLPFFVNQAISLAAPTGNTVWMGRPCNMHPHSLSEQPCPVPTPMLEYMDFDKHTIFREECGTQRKHE